MRNVCVPLAAKKMCGPKPPYALSCHPQSSTVAPLASWRLTHAPDVVPLWYSGVRLDALVTESENCSHNESLTPELFFAFPRTQMWYGTRPSAVNDTST